jgi:hypothetical protein
MLQLTLLMFVSPVEAQCLTFDQFFVRDKIRQDIVAAIVNLMSPRVLIVFLLDSPRSDRDGPCPRRDSRT